jgi:hypothetical protein
VNAAMKKRLYQVIKMTSFLAILFFPVVPSQMAQTKFDKVKNNTCYRWQTQVDPRLERIKIDNSILSVAEIEEAIGCLLTLKGKTHKARLYGTTRDNYYKSEGYQPPKHPASVEIAALYYASFLFYNNWEFASSIVLYDADTEESNSKRNVKRAYKSYQQWFKKVIEIGLEEARKQKLDPLVESEVSWPGQRTQ